MKIRCFEKTIYHFSPFSVCRAARRDAVPLLPGGFRCSEMHSQPYLSPELFQMKILPVLRKQSTFFTLSWCAGLSACVHNAIAAGGLHRPPEARGF